MARIDETAAPVAEKSVESSASAVEWAAIFGGAVAAIGITIILLTLGPGLGLTTVSPWSFANPSPAAFGTVAAIWLVVTQWLASAFGGYLSGAFARNGLASALTKSSSETQLTDYWLGPYQPCSW